MTDEELTADVRSMGCSSCGTGTAVANAVRCGNGLEKVYPTTAVRFSYMRHIGEFTYPPEMRFTCGAKVVVQTKRGIEMGEQVSLTCSGCERAVTREQVKTWVKSCGEESFVFGAGRILREATAADLAEWAHIQQSCRSRKQLCQGLADGHKLSIRLVACECTFGGERIIYYFTAAERVDFRSLARDLAKEYRTRIEMRQVGARDEARLLADFETCGREVCCKVFLKTLRPISMRMAKLQKATLDPTQVSGRCGRLKCCLRYEHVSYEELDKSLPRNGLYVRTSEGDGVVVNRQILTQLIQIRGDTDQLVTVVAEDIQEVGTKPFAPRAPQAEPAQRPEGTARPSEQRRKPAAAKPRRAGPPQDGPGKPGGGDRDRVQTSSADAPAEDKESGEAGPRRRRRRGRRRRRRGSGGNNAGGDSPAPPTGQS